MDGFMKISSADSRFFLERIGLLLAMVLFVSLGCGAFPDLDRHQAELAIPSSKVGLAIWWSLWGGCYAFWICGGYALFLFRRTPQRLPSFLILLAGQHVLMMVSKSLFHTTRPSQPYQVGGHAYPSCHTLLATCLYGYLATYCPAGSAFFWLLPGLVGWSRVALGHHWLRDVLGAALLGWVWLRCCIAWSSSSYR